MYRSYIYEKALVDGGMRPEELDYIIDKTVI